jgi:hypothetical protein
MAENPLRARIREECPRLMERQLHLCIGGREYAAFGNLFLLKYPIKEQVLLETAPAPFLCLCCRPPAHPCSLAD